MPALRNARQEIFTIKWFEGKPITEAAILAGYKPKWAASIASRLSRKVKVLDRYQELQQAAEDASIASVVERKQVLTEIVRGRFADFMTKLTPEKLKSAALQEIRITEVGKDIPIKSTTIKLHNPVQAIDALNKMDGAYAPEKYAHIVKVIPGDLTDAELIAIANTGDNPSRGSNGASEETPSPE